LLKRTASKRKKRCQRCYGGWAALPTHAQLGGRNHERLRSEESRHPLPIIRGDWGPPLVQKAENQLVFWLGLEGTTGLNAAAWGTIFKRPCIVARHKARGRGIKNLRSCHGEHGVIEGIKHHKIICHDLIDQIASHAGWQGEF